jgi:hypothetical protein
MTLLDGHAVHVEHICVGAPGGEVASRRERGLWNLARAGDSAAGPHDDALRAKIEAHVKWTTLQWDLQVEYLPFLPKPP